MPVVIFLIGIAARRPHRSQVRMHSWPRFFNGDTASNNQTAATSQPKSSAECFYAAQARHSAGQLFKRRAPCAA